MYRLVDKRCKGTANGCVKSHNTERIWSSFRRSAGGLSACRVVRQIPHVRHGRLVTRKLATRPDHLDMSRWSENRHLPRNKSVTSWRLPRNICYEEVTRNWSHLNLALYIYAITSLCIHKKNKYRRLYTRER